MFDGEHLEYIWCCDRCANLHPHVMMAAVYYWDVNGKPFEALFSMLSHKDAVIDTHRYDEIVPIGVGIDDTVRSDPDWRCACCLGRAVGSLRDVAVLGVPITDIPLCKRCATGLAGAPHKVITAAFMAFRMGRPYHKLYEWMRK
jgi:hypothetical protein